MGVFGQPGSAQRSPVALQAPRCGGLVGGALDDVFTISGGASLAGSMAGGPGTDTLDYSSWGDPVTVNLQLGQASATGGTSGIENVFGGTGGGGQSCSWFIR